jgi:hypothetical protein
MRHFSTASQTLWIRMSSGLTHPLPPTVMLSYLLTSCVLHLHHAACAALRQRRQHAP